MKFRLYGDSWCYYWLQPGQIKSKDITSVVNCDVNAYDSDNQTLDIHKENRPDLDQTNLYKILFQGLGHELSNLGFPGATFQKVVDFHIIRFDLDPVDFNIVFVPSMFRQADDLNKLPVEVFSSVDTLNEHMSHTQENIIQRLREYAEKTKQHFFLIGGQQPLHNDADKNTGEYVHVLYFDLLMEEHKIDPKHIKEPAWFRMSTDIDWQKVNLESWGDDVLGKVGNDLREANCGLTNWQDTGDDSDPVLQYLLWPDIGHPSPTVMFNVTNKILHLVDKLTNA